MNVRIVALLLLVIPFVFYILHYNDMVPSIWMWASLITVLVIDMCLILYTGRNAADR